MVLLLLGCASCFEPPDEDDDNALDSGELADSGDSGTGGVDTSDSGDSGSLPAALCTLEEAEDDDYFNDYREPVTLPLETWACGIVDVQDDREYFRFTTAETGWLKVDTQAEDRGSSADITHIVTMDDADEAVVQYGRARRSADPLNVFYAPVAGEYSLVLYESAGGHGEAYGWWTMVSETKAPVSWDLTESESNDKPETGERLVEGAVHFGVLGDPGDDDWYHIEIPEGATFMTCAIEAEDHGSAANMEMTLHWGGTGNLYIREDGIDQRDGSEDAWEEYDLALERSLTDAHIEADRKIDPLAWPEGSVDYSSFDMRLHDYDESKGSMFHWYTFTCTFSTEEK